MNRFKGKVALVTGASRGIGKEIALRLGSEGATVAVHFNRNEAAAAEIVREISTAGGKAFAIGADVSKTSEVASMFDTLDRELEVHTGRRGLDIVVNNAGISPVLTIEETTEGQFDEIFAVNVKAPFFVIQHAVGRIRDDGRIINVSSMSAVRARPTLVAYAASKAAVNGMTLALAQHLGNRGITVNAVAPGATDTDMLPDSIREMLKSRVALGRIGTASDVANIVVFLASQDAGWLTGQLLHASGGQEL
ncbi:SDR family oxidoreductase [Variovorax sp. J31P179]|uniref:SDR family NAD(P)-dependent oxidoreductase n=1 Tax=Variovorax sp. J31P179 TaxID=3053508 RepID=UPI0025757266|nr:SDR family oxidoreductase [Variovorax sp. J31P179]MDM0085384.1 SDR family oxidoreductase [Variovorax sp. J31P179]